MKSTTRLLRVSGEAHREFARLANDLGVSMSAVAVLAVESLRRHGVRIRKTEPTKYDRRNSRTVGMAVAAK
jgi:biotin operon repressor